MARRPRIVFTAIVKNEARVIRRCLESVKPHIDAWAISDTGSTDGTQELIREILKDIPGELIERPWVDFATNRNEAIEVAQKFAPDYCLTLDADEELTTQPGFALRELTADCYQFNFKIAGSQVMWPRNALFRPDLRYRYVLDETLDVTGRTLAMLPACIVVSHTDGARSSAGLKEKFTRDADVLRAAAVREPNEPRYWYYLGQRLAGCERYEEAIDAYQKRIALGGGMGAEIGHAQFVIGQCLQALNRPFEEVQGAYLKAFLLNPTRAEPIYALGCLHSIRGSAHAENGEHELARGEHALAELYAREAQRMPRPADPLWVDESIYAYRAAELLAGALAEQGKLNEAADLLEKLISLPQLPAEEHERVRQNIALIRGTQGEEAPQVKLGPDEQAYEGQAGLLRSMGFAAWRRMALEYLTSFQAQALPSPVRWLWIVLVALFGRAAPIAGALAAPIAAVWATLPLAKFQPLALLAASASPLLFLAGRRRLQDAPIAALTLAAAGFALRGEPLGLGLLLFALLAMKEAAVLTIPALGLAWAFSGAGWLPLGLAVGGACAAWLGSLFALFGGMALPMLLAGAKSHGTPYTLEHQRGDWHRLIVDLVLISPVTTFAALFGPWQLVGIVVYLIAAHAIAPVRNVRLVISADLVLRVAAVAAFGWWILPTLAVDLYISRKLRQVYDPVTAALTSQLGMSR